MSTHTDPGQGAFDIASLIRQAELEAAPGWAGAPLAYHTGYRDPEDLDAALERYILEHGRFGCIPDSHMWAASPWDAPVEAGAHRLRVFHADAHCDNPAHDHGAAPLPGQRMTQAVCAPCRWHLIGADESAVVEGWHDHAMPGWRDLPAMPPALADPGRAHRAEAAAAWCAAHYPASWQRPGAPVLTARQPHATRCVPGRSPFGGYDMPAGPR